MSRFHDWPQRLAEFIASSHAEPFVYGTHDCCRFAARCVDALTGAGMVARMDREHPYDSKDGAYAVVAAVGGFVELISLYLGEPMHPSRAGRGDVVLADLEHGATVGVCLGYQCAFAAEPCGVVLRPRTVVVSAWKVR